MGSVPDSGRSHMLESNPASMPPLPSLGSRAWEPRRLKPVCPEPMPCNEGAPFNEKPAQSHQRKVDTAVKSQYRQQLNKH